jgi:hypothetical protein
MSRRILESGCCGFYLGKSVGPMHSLASREDVDPVIAQVRDKLVGQLRSSP